MLRSVSDALVDSDGLLAARINGTSESIEDISRSIQAGEDRIEIVESNLIRQFAALERRVSGLKAQGEFITQFLINSSR